MPPPSAYVPGGEYGGGSHLVNGVQIVPGAPGYNATAALPIIQQEIAPYDRSVANFLQSTGQYDAATQAAVERVARENALREATRQAVVSGQISQAQAQNIVTGVTPPPANIQTQANNIATNAISSMTSGISAGVNDMSTIPGMNRPTTPGSSYVQGMTSPLPPGAGESSIDPTIGPYLSEALARSRYLFLTGEGPQLYPDQMFVSPSSQTEQALTQAERIATSPEAQALSTQGLQAYQGALGGLSSIASGDYMQSPEYQRYLESVTRPVTEQVTQQILPSIASQYSAAGRYGSGAMQQATGRATELGARALGDITSQVAQQQQGRMLEAQTALPRFLGSMPEVLGGALAPSTALAGVGAQREAIAGQPLQEAIRRFEYGQQLPYSQLSGYLSSIYGSPLGRLTGQPEMQGSSTLQNIGGLFKTVAAVPDAVRGVQAGYDFLSGLIP
jgi:hypothetical protein